MIPGTIAYAIENSGVNTGTAYCFKNVYSGKYLQVHGGVDANNQNVNQWTKDGSVDQKFKMVYNASNDAYKFRAMCSSSGNSRVLDLRRNSDNSITSGCNAQLWTADDDATQYMRFIHYGYSCYYIVLKSNPNLALTVADGANGSQGGISTTSAGNVFFSTIKPSSASDVNKQLWYIEESNPTTTAGIVDGGIYYIESRRSGKNMDVDHAGTANATNVWQWEKNGTPAQQWKVSYLGNGYYIIRPMISLSMALNIDGRAFDNNTQINIWNIGQPTPPR